MNNPFNDSLYPYAHDSFMVYLGYLKLKKRTIQAQGLYNSIRQSNVGSPAWVGITHGSLGVRRRYTTTAAVIAGCVYTQVLQRLGRELTASAGTSIGGLGVQRIGQTLNKHIIITGSGSKQEWKFLPDPDLTGDWVQITSIRSYSYKNLKPPLNQHNKLSSLKFLNTNTVPMCWLSRF